MAQNDADFLKLSPADQKAYMVETDPEFSKLSDSDQKAYLDYRTGGAYSRPAAANAKVNYGPPNYVGDFAKLAANPEVNPFIDVVPALMGEAATEALPFERMGRTAFRALDQLDLTKPQQLITRLPEIWEGTAPGAMGVERAKAAEALMQPGEAQAYQENAEPGRSIREGRASKIPTAGPRSVGAQSEMPAATRSAVAGRTASYIPTRVGSAASDLMSETPAEKSSGVIRLPEPTKELPGGKGSAFSMKRPSALVQAGKQGYEGPGEVMKLAGKNIMYEPKEGWGYPGPRTAEDEAAIAGAAVKPVSGGSSYAGPERRLVQSPVAIEQRAREAGMHRIGPFQDTEGAMKTIMRDPDMPKYPGSMTGGHAGGGASSEEELSRPGTNYVVGKKGVTAHGKSFAPEGIGEGQTHVTHLGNGQYRVNAGPDLTTKQQGQLATALGVDKVEAQR